MDEKVTFTDAVVALLCKVIMSIHQVNVLNVAIIIIGQRPEQIIKMFITLGEADSQIVKWRQNKIFFQMETGTCKWCGKEVPVSVLMQFGGYCCPVCYQAGHQHTR